MGMDLKNEAGGTERFSSKSGEAEATERDTVLHPPC
jgi:hypothetical protein